MAEYKAGTNVPGFGNSLKSFIDFLPIPGVAGHAIRGLAVTGVDAFTGQMTDNPMGPEDMKNGLIRNIAGVDASKLNGDWWHDAMSILSDLTTGLAPKPAPDKGDYLVGKY